MASVESSDLCLASFVIEITSDPERTVWTTAATNANTFTVTVEDLGLKAVLNCPCLQSFLECDKGRELLIGFECGHVAGFYGGKVPDGSSYEYASVNIANDS